jgi:hypothetical protein
MDFMDDVRDWSTREADRRLAPDCHRYRIASRRAHNQLMMAALRGRLEGVVRLALGFAPRIRFHEAGRNPPVLRPRRP